MTGNCHARCGVGEKPEAPLAPEAHLSLFALPDDFTKIISTMRSRNISCNIILQNKAQLQALFGEQFGFTEINVNDLRYGQENAAGAITSKRFFPEDKVSFICKAANGSVGTGLWGVTPEEESLGQYTEKSAQQFITLTQWATPDPVAVWTKASGLFIPVLPNPDGLFIATVTI